MTKGEAIEFFKRKLTLRSNATEDDLAASYFALDALELQVPKEPTFVKVLYDKHDWKKEKDGSIDEFGLDFGFHNGPICSRCYYSFCMHCVSDYEAELESGPCDCSYYTCPNCGDKVFRSSNFCKCGQRIKWEVSSNETD